MSGVRTFDDAMLDLWLPYPPSANRIWRAVPNRGVLLSRVGRSYRAHAIAAVRSTVIASLGYIYDEPLFEDWRRVAVRMDAFPPDKRSRRDIDNLPKASHDALSAAGVWADDSQVDVLLVVRREVVRCKETRVNGALHVRIIDLSMTRCREMLFSTPDSPDEHALLMLAMADPKRS